MGVSLEEVIGRLPAEERHAVETRGAELIADETTLRALRKALGKTQVAIARDLGVNQESVSRIEQRSDMLLSTLSDYLRSMGGRLRLIAEFEGRPPVEVGILIASASSSKAPAKSERKRPAVFQAKAPVSTKSTEPTPAGGTKRRSRAE